MNLIKDIVLASWQLLLEVSPYLLLGFLFAGIIHAFIGESYIKKHLGGEGFKPILKSVIFGIPLPVCSCGVIPLAASLRREGASKPATLAFLISTPTTGIDSIFATYAFLGVLFALFRPIAALTGGLLIGFLIWMTEKEAVKEETPHSHPEVPVKDKIKKTLVHGFETLPADIGKWLLLGILIGGVITAIVPENYVKPYLSNPYLAYPLMLAISIPLYVCATGSIPIAASLLWKGLNPGAALAFLIAGPATNTITITFVLKELGKKVLFLYLFSIITIATLLGVLFDFLWKAFKNKPALLVGGGRHISPEIQIFSAILLLALILKANLKEKEEKMAGKYKILVKDMTCKHCKMTIERTLNKLEGVNKVVVSLPEKEVIVDGDLPLEKIVEAIRKAGYSPEVEK